MFFNQFKTALLLGALSGLFLFLGYALGGSAGVKFALIFSFIINMTTYFFADKIVLRAYRAQQLDEEKYPNIYRMVRELADQARIPMPQLWYLPTHMPNAFATGRNPSHAHVAVTEGILELLNEKELRGVLAHEISHVKNRDILISSIAAVIASAIGHLAYMMRWATIFSSSEDNRKGSILGVVLISIFMPFAAALIQLAISRSREYLADESGAEYSEDPLALASALEKLEYGVKHNHLDTSNPSHTSTAGLFIMHPFSARGVVSSIFSTHPPTEKRVARLRAMADRYYR